MSSSLSAKITPILKFIDQHDNFVLTAHENSDGDAIGSVLAFSCLLEKMNKKWRIIFHDQEIDNKYAFLHNYAKIESYNKELHASLKFGAGFVFDAPGKRRIADVTEIFDKIPVVKIDHHPGEDTFSEADWVDTSFSSVSAMVYEVIEQSGITIDAKMGEAIYTGIIFDTGRLSFSNTRTRDFEVCAVLTACGVSPARVTNNLFFSNSLHALHTIGYGLKSMQSYSEGRIGVIFLHKEQLNNVATGDYEVLANYSISLQGVEVGVFIRQVETNFFKISLRSKEYVEVNKIAARLDGGGHKRASGCRFSGNYDQLITKIIPLIENEL